MSEKKTRKRIAVSEETKLLNKTRKLLPINTLEVEISQHVEHRTYRKSNKNKYFKQDAVRYVASVSEEMRQLQNTIQGVVYKRFLNLAKTKKYRGMMKSYRKLNEQILKIEKNKKVSKEEKEVLSKLKISKKELSDKIEDLKIEHKIAKTFAVEDASMLKDTTFKRVNSILALKCADRVWLAMEKLMYSNGQKLRFKKAGEMPSLEGKQASRGIILKLNKENKLYLSYDKFKFDLKIKKDDLYTIETLEHIKEYMVSGTDIESQNIELLKNNKKMISTYRVLYNRIVLKKIRGKLRLFLQIVYEGATVPKRKKDGSFKHYYGEGNVGCDVGTQSIAVVSKNNVFLKNLAERSKNAFNYENKVRLVVKAMDRSRRANNKDFYNIDGTFKKYKDRPKNVKIRCSKKYLELRNKHRELHRKAALSRKYAINEDVNKIRALGDKVIVEKMSIQGLQKKAKETTINKKTGKFNKKKRFGKSIGKRCPGGFMTQLKQRFESTGGEYIEIKTWTFKASQYDHMLNDCNKKQLSKRWHVFENGLKVQRDAYSAMLLYCTNKSYTEPDNKKCMAFFDKFLELHQNCINSIITNKYRVMNSGIKI